MTTKCPAASEERRAVSLDGGEDGQSLIEFALCLPPLLLLMTGIFVFGIALANYLQLTNACTVGALQLSIDRQNLPSPNYDPCATAVSAVQGAAPILTPASIKFVVVLNGTSYPTDGTPTASLSCTSSSETTGAAANLVQGKTVTVTATYPCNLMFFRNNNFPSCTLTAKSSELVQ